MISESHGAAIEFVTNVSTSHFQSMRTNDRIEVAVFGGVFNRAHGLPFQITHIRLIWALESGVNFMAGGNCMFEVYDNATLAVVGSNWTLDGISYYNPITVKGSNFYESWAANRAIWDAEFDFRYDLAYALNESEGVREYVAYSDLKDSLRNIADRMKNDPNYGWSQLESDLSEVSRIASERYGITRSDFIKDVFDVIKEKTTLDKKLPILPITYDSNYTYTIFFSVLLDLSYVLAISLDRLLRRMRTRLLKPLAKILKQFGEWFTFIFVLVSFFTCAPFGYEWSIHVPILAIQLVALVFLSRAVIKLRSSFRFNWRSLLHRLAFGVFFPLLALAAMLLLLPIFHAMPSLFDSYSITVGEVTAFSILAATTATIAILVSQLAYDCLFKNRNRRVLDKRPLLGSVGVWRKAKRL